MRKVDSAIRNYEALRSEILDDFDITAEGAQPWLYGQLATLFAMQPEGYNERDNKLISRVFKPEVSTHPETLEKLTFCLDNNIPVISLADHVHLWDHMVDKATYMSLPGLERIKEEGMILAKSPYFFAHRMGRLKRKRAEVYLDQRAIPVFRRPKDIVPLVPEDQRDNSSYIRGLLRPIALEAFISSQLDGGGFLHIYPESTRNHHKPREVLEMKALALKTIKNLIRNDKEFAVMFTGHSYGHYKRTYGFFLAWDSPNVHIDNIVMSDDLTEEQKSDLKAFCGQGVLKAKTKAYEKRVGPPVD